IPARASARAELGKDRQSDLRREWRQSAHDIRLGTLDTMFCFGLQLRSAASPGTLVRRGDGRRVRLAVAIAAAAISWTAATATAQAPGTERYFPFDQATAPGVAGRWASMQPGFVPAIQPVRVELPGGAGQISFYSGPDARAVTSDAPAVAG